ncbi:50S ribosomal protein L24 [Rubrobacter aplysinae]|uniref:50S ribosomal protein L24 n=1 Tax=Rubrobacter aplysinae TaxID=909625 RepID=UPI00064BCA35|nr:50S ribosomal protein L24 [Rubrobacter aplysinae]
MGVRIKRGDTVKVISGPESGKTGEVERVIPKSGRVVIGGVNIRTRHAQPTQNNQQGLYTFEAPVHASNVMVVGPDGEPTRVGFRVNESGQKVRVAKRSGKDMD